MPKVTYYVALPFLRNQEGDLIAGEAKDATNAGLARSRAEAMVGRSAAIPKAGRGKGIVMVEYVGAIVFSRTGDPEFGDFDDAVILARYGETPDDLALG